MSHADNRAAETVRSPGIREWCIPVLTRYPCKCFRDDSSVLLPRSPLSDDKSFSGEFVISAPTTKQLLLMQELTKILGVDE